MAGVFFFSNSCRYLINVQDCSRGHIEMITEYRSIEQDRNFWRGLSEIFMAFGKFLARYKGQFGLLLLFLSLSFFMPIFMGVFFVAIGALVSRALFDQGRTELSLKKLMFIGGSLVVLAFTIWALIYFTPSLNTDWETDGPYDGLIIAMMGIAFIAVLLFLPLVGYLADRYFRTKSTKN
ncbi:hypothetical protein [Aurantimicrobium sp.]